MRSSFALTYMYETNETSSPSRCASQCPLIISSCINRKVHGLWDLYSSPYSPQRGPTRYSTRPLQVPATMYIVYVYTACCYVLWLRYAYSYSCSLLSALKCRQCFVLFCSSVHQEFLSLCLVLGVYIIDVSLRLFCTAADCSL